MTIFHQATAAVLLLILTLWLQCAGVAALIEWLKRIMARGIYTFGSIRAAALVMQTTVVMIVLHSLVILLWAGFYRCVVSHHGSLPFTSREALMRRWDMVMSSSSLWKVDGSVDVWSVG